MESGLQAITRRHENVVESFVLLLRRQSARLKLIGCKEGGGGRGGARKDVGIRCMVFVHSHATRVFGNHMREGENGARGGRSSHDCVCLFLQAERRSLRVNDRAGVWRLIILGSGSGQLVVFFSPSFHFLPLSLILTPPPARKETNVYDIKSLVFFFSFFSPSWESL